MRLTKDRICESQGEQAVTLDWESLGRRVRQQTLVAVALHFSELASRDLGPARTSAQAKARGSAERLVSES